MGNPWNKPTQPNIKNKGGRRLVFLIQLIHSPGKANDWEIRMRLLNY